MDGGFKIFRLELGGEFEIISNCLYVTIAIYKVLKW